MTKKKKQDSIWYSSDAAEKIRIREFWLQLSEEDRKGLVKLEKEAVLKKMKEQQRSNCSCNVCGRKKSVIEEELEILYDAYYEELEHFANDQKKKSSNSTPDDMKSSGILHVADDFLKNDGQKFLCLMEELASQRLRVMEEEGDKEGLESDEEDWDDVYDEEDESEGYDEEDEEESIGEQQRMAEGRRMFQIFAAKMFEQRVLTAYREKVAQERQRRLLEELEEEEKAKEGAKLEKEKKKAAKKALKRQKEEERLRKEKNESALKEQEENALKEAEENRLALEKEEREKARLLEIQKEEEARARRLKEEAERKEAQEQLQKKLAKEQLLQKKKLQEQLLQKEREEAKLRIQKEAEEKAKEDRKKEKDEKIKAAKRERKERKARERTERESTLKAPVSDKVASLSTVDSGSLPHSSSQPYSNHLTNQHNLVRLDTSIHPPQVSSSGLPTVPIPIKSEGLKANHHHSHMNPPGLAPAVQIDRGVAFSPLSYGLSLSAQDLNSRGAPVQPSLHPLGFIGQTNPGPPLPSLGQDQSFSGIPLPIHRHIPIHRSQSRPPGIKEPELSPLYVDEAATLRLSGLYEEADELVSSSPVANADLLSGINKAPSSSWSSLIGNTNLPNPHIGLENLWSQNNPSLSKTSVLPPPSHLPSHALTHQQFLQMQTMGAFSVPPPPGYPSPISLTGPGTPIGQKDGASAWPTHRFFDSTL